MSRMGDEGGKSEPMAKNIFKNLGIYNSQGERLDQEKLFSLDKQREMNCYFESTKRGSMVRVFNCSEMMGSRGNGHGENGRTPQT